MHVGHQTIYALSSGRVPCAIALVRVSGPQAAYVIETLAGHLPQPRRAMRALLRDATCEPIDDALVLWFPQPASATGEDVAEFHVHGSRAVIAALFAAFARIDGLRAAEPGEFTRRAFENGKLDLTEAEALDDLIHSDTDKQRKQALRQLNGLLGDKARRWRADIIEACALIEAGIDFSDEGDVPDELRGPALAKVATLRAEIDDVLALQGRSERLRDGLVVAIAGPPNVGKSTLINQLARREVAIVSPHAGTTRDIIEVQLDLDGYPIVVIDTAGIRDTDDPVEQEGVRRAKKRAAEADLILWLYDGFSDSGPPGVGGDAPVWRVRNKADLGGDITADYAISASRGDGLPDLISAIATFAADYFGGHEDAMIGRARQRDLLTEAAAALGRTSAARRTGDELIAEELRIAAQALGRLLGRVDVEDVLDVIFSQFCIGK